MKTSAIELESEWFKAVVLPEVGCKVQSLVAQDREILWQNPRVPPRPYPIDANFDNYWSGGWDDAFPTCDACEYAGERYPNLGELRSLEWSIDTAEPSSATFSAYGPISPVRAWKTVTLDLHQPVLRMHLTILNLGVLPLPFIAGTHPALRVTRDTLLRIPARTGIVGAASTPRLGVPGQQYSWPFLESQDMSRVLPVSTGSYCGHYVTDLDAGWFAVEDSSTGEGTLFAFPVDLCPTLWLWMCYGGWRGYGDVVVIEPWTSRPVRLDQAIAAGTNRCLQPGSRFELEIRVTTYRTDEGLDAARQRVEFD